MTTEYDFDTMFDEPNTTNTTTGVAPQPQFPNQAVQQPQQKAAMPTNFDFLDGLSSMNFEAAQGIGLGKFKVKELRGIRFALTNTNKAVINLDLTVIDGSGTEFKGSEAIWPLRSNVPFEKAFTTDAGTLYFPTQQLASLFKRAYGLNDGEALQFVAQKLKALFEGQEVNIDPQGFEMLPIVGIEKKKNDTNPDYPRVNYFFA